MRLINLINLILMPVINGQSFMKNKKQATKPQPLKTNETSTKRSRIPKVQAKHKIEEFPSPESREGVSFAIEKWVSNRIVVNLSQHFEI